MQVVYVALLTALADQSSKLLVQDWMILHESIPVIPGFFHITYILNRGAAFGMLENQQWFFLGMAAVLFVLYGLFHKRIPAHRAVQAGMGLLLGGAFGNALDRFCYGAVVDFFDFRIWPVFNVADMGIVVGVGLLLWYSWTHISE